MKDRNSDIDGLQEFIDSVKKVRSHRIHRIRNSYGVYDGFKYYRKNKPASPEYILTESQYFSIIRKINTILGEALANGEDITLPCSLGRLEIRKYEPKIHIDNEKVRANLPIDWNRTIKLWYEDKESYQNKTLIKINEKEIFKIYYNRNIANYTNKSFYQFKVNRSIKERLKDNIRMGNIEAFMIKK